MPINLSIPDKPILKPSINVFGVGGAGCNAVNNMIQANLEGITFIVANTDAQALEHSHAERKIQLGETITQGLGAGSYPEVGKASAEEAIDEIKESLRGANMVFITAGMGGGTGTGAAPVVAKAARELGILTIAVVTKPFHFEGANRMRLAEAGLEDLEPHVDTMIVTPNQNLFRVADKSTTFADAFKMADTVLRSGVRGITDLMIMPGLINLDFADVRSVMSEMGKAMMGTGEAEGESRATQAAEAAIANPLLDNVSMKGARGVLINITGGDDLTLFEVDEAANRIRQEVDPEANIIFGSAFQEGMDGQIRVSVVATGITNDDEEKPRRATPRPAMRQPASQEDGDSFIPAKPVEAKDMEGSETKAVPMWLNKKREQKEAEHTEFGQHEENQKEPATQGIWSSFLAKFTGTNNTTPEAEQRKAEASTLLEKRPPPKAVLNSTDPTTTPKTSEDQEELRLQPTEDDSLDVPAYLRRKPKTE